MAKRANAKGTREIAGASHALSVSEPEVVVSVRRSARYTRWAAAD
jgi:hypothetical protein